MARAWLRVYRRVIEWFRRNGDQTGRRCSEVDGSTRERSFSGPGVVLVAAIATIGALAVVGSLATARQGAVQYVYDSAGRLIKITYPNAVSVEYSYDSAGNRTIVQAVYPNAPPVAQNDSGFQTPSGAAITLDPRGNDSDPEGGALTIVSVSNAVFGVASVAAGGASVTFTPAPNYIGPASFSYTVEDNQKATAIATISLLVTNRAPIANTDAVSTLSNSVSTASVLDNDVDPEGGALSLVSVASAANGAASIASARTVTFTPATNFVGVGGYTYTAADPNGAQSTTTVTVTIQNRPPNVGNDTIVADAASKTFDPRVNDSDPEGRALSLVSVRQPPAGRGQAALTDGNTTITYTPPAGFSGSTSFTYIVADANGGESIGTVTVNNAAPIARPDTVTTLSNSAVTFDPRTNDSDPEGSALRITAAMGVNGTAIINSGTSVTFTPAANYVGSASYSYSIVDPAGATGTSTVTVVVNNRAPVANTDNVSTLSNTAVTTSVLDNDGDPEGGALTLVGVSNAVNGVASMSVSARTTTFTPNQNFVGTASYQYTTVDPFGAQATATVFVTVRNRAPIALNDATSTVSNTVLTFDPRGNDSDPEGGPLTLVSIVSATNGSASVAANAASVTFLPNADFTGPASFTYTVRDSFGATASALVSIDVRPPPITVTNPTLSVASRSTTTFTLSQLATIVGGGSIVSFSPSQGAATLAAGGQSVTYSAPINTISFCDAPFATNLQVDVPYVIRHNDSGATLSGQAKIQVGYAIIGAEPRGGCP